MAQRLEAGVRVRDAQKGLYDDNRLLGAIDDTAGTHWDSGKSDPLYDYESTPIEGVAQLNGVQCVICYRPEPGVRTQ